MDRTDEIKYAENVRSQYMPHEETKLEKLRKLDGKVKLPAQILAYILGSAGALILGTGMCLCMKVIGASLSFAMPLGIAIGLAGIALCAATCFIYKAFLKARKNKYGGEVIALSDELLNK